MNVLSLIAAALLCAGPEIGVGVSPDQPLPYSFVDDPLVVELRSATDVKAELTLQATIPGMPPAGVKAGPIELRSGAPGLLAFPGVPALRGIFAGSLEIVAGGETKKEDIQLARIDRLAATPSTLPVYIYNVETVAQVLAARAAGVAAIRVDISLPNFAELVRVASPMLVAPLVKGDQPDVIAPAIATLAPELVKNIYRWVVDPKDDVAALQRISDAIRTTPCKAPVAMVVSDAAGFERLLAGGAGKYAHAAVLASDVTTGKEARLLLDVAEHGGYEAWPLHVLASSAAGNGAASRAMQQVIANLAAGAVSTGLDASLLYDGKKMGEAFVALNALGKRLVATQHAGNLQLATSVSAPLFREGAHWVLAIWSEGSEKEVPVPVEGAQELQLSDAAGNSVPLPEVKDGALPVKAGPMPVILSGTGGAVLGQAARTKAQNTARRLLDDKVLQRWLAPELRALVQAAADKKGELDRPSILALMRSLPELERQWHQGKLPRGAAVSIIADVARLCRQMSTIEEDKGQAYLEPMHDMLARSEEMQSIYLTGAGGGSEAHERGDWILSEVRRLIDESKALAESDRKIEAAGVAALAEWRARGLEFAATEGDKSRLSEQEVIAAGVAPAPAPAPAATPAPAAEEAKAAPAEEKPAPKAEEKPAAKPEEKPAPKAEEKPTLKADEKLEPGQPKGSRKVMHTVVKGDTLESIVKQYGVDYEAFRIKNGLRKGAMLSPGKQYVVYAPAKEEKAPAKGEKAAEKPAKAESEAGAPAGTKKITHTVAKGDNPSTIAKKYGVKTEDFLKWNKLKPDARFQIGEEYTVFVPTKR